MYSTAKQLSSISCSIKTIMICLFCCSYDKKTLENCEQNHSTALKRSGHVGAAHFSGTNDSLAYDRTRTIVGLDLENYLLRDGSFCPTFCFQAYFKKHNTNKQTSQQTHRALSIGGWKIWIFFLKRLYLEK